MLTQFKTLTDLMIAFQYPQTAIDHFKALEKKKEITEDDVKGHESRVQKMTDQHVANADDLGKKKEAELMSV